VAKLVLVPILVETNWIFCTSQQIRIVSLGRVINQPWKAILHCTRTLQDMKTMKCGIDLILRIIPYLLQTNFDFLSLAYLIHAFRISKLYCKAIKLKVEDELRVRLWRLFQILYSRLLIFILSNTSFFFHNLFRPFSSSYLFLSCTWILYSCYAYLCPITVILSLHS
jgi:hypothetical protein